MRVAAPDAQAVLAFEVDFPLPQSVGASAPSDIRSGRAARISGLCVVRGTGFPGPRYQAETKMTASDSFKSATGKLAKSAPTTESAEPDAAAAMDRPASKLERLRALLAQEGGATLELVQQSLGWQPHAVRAAISGLRKAGLDVRRETSADGTRYRICGSQAG